MNYKDMSDDELAKALKDYAEHRSGEIADLTYAASLRISVLSAGGNRSEWIPVSKREPEEYGEYMITWTTSHSMAGGKGLIGDAEYELTNEYDHEKNRFKGEWLLPEYIQNYPDVKVIAWMPLPEPYKAESEDKRMKELFEYILIALACPLVLPLVEPQERSDKGMTLRTKDEQKSIS